MANRIDKLVVSTISGGLILYVFCIVLSELDKVIGPTINWKPVIVLLGLLGTVSFVVGLLRLLKG
jgi:hypothetical protein